MNHDNIHMLDKPENVRRLIRLLFAICALLFTLDLFIHRHTMHDWDDLLGFYALYGFIGCVALVFVAKWMRTILMRSEKYYDRRELKDLEENHDLDT